MLRRTLLICILFVFITGCKGGNPSALSGVASGSTNGNNQSITPTSETARQVGNGKLELILDFQSKLPDGGNDHTNDSGNSVFTITQKQAGGDPVYNEFIIEGQGKLVSKFDTTSAKCAQKGDTTGITTISGTMTGGFNSNAINACILFMHVEAFFGPRKISLERCPISSATSPDVNYAFDTKMPLLKNHISNFIVPDTAWQLQLNSARLLDLQIDEARTGCKLLTNP